GDVIRKFGAGIGKASSRAGTDARSSMIRAVSDVNVEDARQIAETISKLYAVKSTRDLSVEEFVNDVCDAMGTEVDRGRLTKNLLALLSDDKLGLTAKALDLQTDDERTFCGDSRILTDLRPVFGAGISEGPKAMVIVHILKLGYHSTGSGRHRDFYVSMDAEDLKALRNIIDRAEEKAESLKAKVDFEYLAKS